MKRLSVCLQTVTVSRIEKLKLSPIFDENLNLIDTILFDVTQAERQCILELLPRQKSLNLMYISCHLNDKWYTSNNIRYRFDIYMISKRYRNDITLTIAKYSFFSLLINFLMYSHIQECTLVTLYIHCYYSDIVTLSL